MDGYKFEVLKLLRTLSFHKKLTFANIISERLLQNYIFFSVKKKWGNYKILEELIFRIYKLIIDNSNLNDNDILNLTLKIENVTPDTEDFEGVSVSFALDACTSIISTLSFLSDQNDDHIAAIATYARDTVDMFIQSKEHVNSNNKNIEKMIETDAFMVNEKKFQKNLLILLLVNDLINEEFINKLRNLSNYSIIDLTLIDEGDI